MSEIEHSLLSGRGASVAKAEGALLGLASGDALGWPQEFPAKSRGRTAASASTEFQPWVRKSGGRFYPHQEEILAGEYSDDTQLTLAVARCRALPSPAWWLAWTRTELPLWLLYERGGGGATRRAAESWLRGIAPWKDSDSAVVRRYLEAGGNGVAMRVLPHSIFFANEESPNNLLHDVVLDGAATHGHPRALIGATAYALSAWWLLRVQRTVRYGELIEMLLDESAAWRQLPGSTAPRNGWLEVANQHTEGGYERLWQQVVDEMRALLARGLRGISDGALADDQEILRDLGSYGREKGAGTISAAAAIYLCARYAAQPTHGVLRAAFANGADTDTVAAMTGGLLGCLAGTDWLPGDWLRVQDADYLRRMASRLAGGSSELQERPAELRHVGSKDLESICRNLLDAQHEELDLDGVRRARVLDSRTLTSSSKTTTVHNWKLHTFDGQTLYVTKYFRKPKETLPSASVPANQEQVQARSPSVRKLGRPHAIAVGIRLMVRDLEGTSAFYEGVLGLSPVQKTDQLVSYGSVTLIRFGSEDDSSIADPRPSDTIARFRIEIRVADLAAVRALIQPDRLSHTEGVPVTDTHGESLLCCDPEGNMIELSVGPASSASGPAT